MKKFLLLGLAVFAASAVRADTVGFNTTFAGNANSTPNSTVGYTFTLANPIMLTQLGFWDFTADGLFVAVPVTIWNSNQVVQATATVPAGTTAGEVNQYLYVSLLAPVTLLAGTYTIAGYTTDSKDFSQSTLTEPRQPLASPTALPASSPATLFLPRDSSRTATSGRTFSLSPCPSQPLARCWALVRFWE